MLHSVSEVGASLKEKREEAENITSLGLIHGYGEMTDKDGDKSYSSMKGKRQKGEFWARHNLEMVSMNGITIQRGLSQMPVQDADYQPYLVGEQDKNLLSP